MKIKNRKLVIIVIGLCTITGILANTIIKSYKEYDSTHAFIVTKVKTFESGTIGLYSGSERINTANYKLSEYDAIKIGDSIYKGKHEKYLFIYRKANDGKYQLLSKEKPTGLFSGFWSYK